MIFNLSKNKEPCWVEHLQTNGVLYYIFLIRAVFVLITIIFEI